jgi:hypothetical protein
LSRVPIEDLEEIKSHWEEQNIIDVGRDYKHGIFHLDDENLKHALQWYLRGMSIFLAVRKVRCDLVKIVIKSKKANSKKFRKYGFKGFKIRTRVIVSSQPEYSEDIIGWKGTIAALCEDYCFVKFDLDSQQKNGRDKHRKIAYNCLSIDIADPPTLNQKKQFGSKDKSRLKAEKTKTENLIPNPEKAKLDIELEQNKSQPPLPTKEELKPAAKVEYTMAELVENIKLSKPIDSPASQDKPSYTAIELAEKLNVSRAKIYQMRSSGTLEAAGYRVESSGRSLSFVPILQ